MHLTLALFGLLCVFATPAARRRLHDRNDLWKLRTPPAMAEMTLISSRGTLPPESQARLVQATGNPEEIKRHLSTLAARQLQALNSTSNSSESLSLYSSSTSTSCTEAVDGVSVTSRVVVNGTRFGACYNNRTFQASGYPAYITSREENGLAVRGDEGLLVVEYTESNETLSYWALVELDGVESDSMICYNRVDPSSAGTPTSSLLDGEWLCDVDGTGGYYSVDDIQIDCGCSAGIDAEEYYACQQYDDFSMNSSGGLIIDGVSVDGCYEINTMIGTSGYHSYFAGPVEDGVAAMFVSSYSRGLTGEESMFWSLAVYYESGVNAVCFLDAEVLNTTADTATPLSDGDWYCDFDDGGSFEPYDGTIEVQCACIDDSYSTCYENAEGLSLDSSIVFDGDSIGGCYVPTRFTNNNAQVFSLFGDPSIVGSIVMHLVRHEDTALNFDNDVWAVSRVREFDEDTEISTFETICLTLVVDIELPTDPFLQGRWLCLNDAGEYFSKDDSDFEEVSCGCPVEASFSSTSSSSTPAPILHATSPASNLLYPTSRPAATTTTEYPLPSATSPPVFMNDASEEQTRQYTPVGVIVGSSIGGAILIAGVVTLILCGRSRSKRSVRDSCSSPAGDTSGGGHPLQSRQNNAASTPLGLRLPSVNHGRPMTHNGNENGNNSTVSPPGYEDMVSH